MKLHRITKEDVVFQESGTICDADCWFVLIPQASEFVYLQAIKGHNDYSLWADHICKTWWHEPTDEDINYLNNSLDRPRDEMGM